MSEKYENVTFVELAKIAQNPRNVELDQLTSEESIRILANTIAKEGLLQPIVVYKDGSSYTILAGHKRFRAAKYLKWDSIPCRVVPKPANDDEEMITMLVSNQYRSTPEEIEALAMLAERKWSNMDKELKRKYREKYRNAFEEKNKENPDYLADKDKYTNSRFSPKCDFIRETTGLTRSNSTVKDLLTRIRNEETGKAQEEEVQVEELDLEKEKEEQSKLVDNKKLLKGIGTFENLVSDYCENDSADKSVIYELGQALDILAGIKPLLNRNAR